MYRCDVCAFVVPANTPCNKIVVEIRPIEHPPRPKVHFQSGGDGGKGKWVDDPGGHGTAIVREVNACAACAAKASTTDHDAEHPPPALIAAA
jgi:hypothetical protein